MLLPRPGGGGPLRAFPLPGNASGHGPRVSCAAPLPPPSSSGRGRRPFKAVARVRIPLGASLGIGHITLRAVWTGGLRETRRAAPSPQATQGGPQSTRDSGLRWGRAHSWRCRPDAPSSRRRANLLMTSRSEAHPSDHGTPATRRGTATVALRTAVGPKRIDRIASLTPSFGATTDVRSA